MWVDVSNQTFSTLLHGAELRCWSSTQFFLFWNKKKKAIKVFFTSTWNKLFTTLLKPGVGVSLFTGRMKVFLLISAAGARLLSPRNAIQKQIHASTHTLWLKMSTKQRLNWANITGTHSKAVKNFLWSLTGLHVQSNQHWAAGSDVVFCLDLKDSAQK